MELKPGYKQTEVGVIPEDWLVKPLKKVSSMSGRIGWQGLKQEEFTDNPDDPFLITGMNFKDGKIKWEEVYHIPAKRYEEATPIQLKADDVLMTKDGTIGKLLYVDSIPYPGKASLNSHLLVFRPLDNQYAPKFLFYQLHSKTFAEYIELNKSGSTFFGLTQEATGNYKAFLPPLPEQRAIAGALGDVDSLLGALERLIAKKRDLKQAAMQQLLTGRKRLPGFTGKWETKKVGELLNYERPDKYMVKSTDYQENAMTPVLTANKSFVLGYTSEDFGIYGNLPAIIFDDFTTDSKYVDFPFKVKSSAIKILKSRSPTTNLKFVYERMRLIQFPLGEHKRYYISEFQHIEIPTPEPDEQIAIAEALSDMDAEIAALEQRLVKTRVLKQGMMQELLTGKTRLI
jgi:type I restriction enzyme S subunit